jgi:hypothetical protein
VKKNDNRTNEVVINNNNISVDNKEWAFGMVMSILKQVQK